MSEPQPSKDLVKADDPKGPQPIGRAVELPTWQRVLAGGLGTAGGFAGIWAIIVSGKDGAGSVALIVASIVFWIIALVGVIPYKLWGKDMGYELGEIEGARKVAVAVADEVSSETMDSILDAVVRAPMIGAADSRRVLESLVASELASARDTSKSFAEMCTQQVELAIALLPPSLSEGIRVDTPEADLADQVLTTKWGLIYFDYRRSLQESTYRSITTRFMRRTVRSDTPIRMVVIAGAAAAETVRKSQYMNPELGKLVPVWALSSGARDLALMLEDLMADLRRESAQFQAIDDARRPRGDSGR